MSTKGNLIEQTVNEECAKALGVILTHCRLIVVVRHGGLSARGLDFAANKAADAISTAGLTKMDLVLYTSDAAMLTANIVTMQSGSRERDQIEWPENFIDQVCLFAEDLDDGALLLSLSPEEAAEFAKLWQNAMANVSETTGLHEGLALMANGKAQCKAIAVELDHGTVKACKKLP